MNKFKIGERWIGRGEPAYIIAEIGINHNGVLQYARQLVAAAVDAGADAVKFQKRHLPSLYPRQLLDYPNHEEKGFQFLLPFLREMELSDADYYSLRDYAEERGVTFLCSPWDMESVDFLEALGVPAYKTASADLTNLPLLEYIASKGKPMLVSTGMSTFEELNTSVEYLKGLGVTFALLHCNSTYPCSFEDINLRFIDTLYEFGVPVGYSGHERGIAISTAAVALDACIIERHITLDRTMEGPDHAASLEPQGFRKMVRDIRHLEAAMGSGQKGFSQGEILNREILAKSLVAARPLPRGTQVARDMVTVKGPGKGISPQHLDHLMGRTLQRDLDTDEPFLEEDIVDIVRNHFDGHLPWEWGVVIRFRDLDELITIAPRVIEFHLTYEDIELDWQPGNYYSQRLVIHAPEWWHRSLVNLCSLNEQRRLESVKIVQQSIDVARRLAPYFSDTPMVVVHPGAMSLEPLADRNGLIEQLVRSVADLDHDGIELLPENLPPRPWYFGGQWVTNAFMDAREIRQFCEQSGLKICFDTSHSQLYCNMFKMELLDEINILRPYIRHLHLSDAAGIDGEGLQIGNGVVDFKGVIKMLRDGTYTMVPEIWRGHQQRGAGFFVALERLAAIYESL